MLRSSAKVMLGRWCGSSDGDCLVLPGWYPRSPICSQRSRGSMNMRKRSGERVSPCMVPLSKGIGLVGPKGVEMVM